MNVEEHDNTPTDGCFTPGPRFGRRAMLGGMGALGLSAVTATPALAAPKP